MGWVKLIDKNSLWSCLNIQKRRLCVKGILAQDLGFVWAAFSAGIRGIFGIIVPDHLLPRVRDVGTHRGQPLQGIKAFEISPEQVTQEWIPEDQIPCSDLIPNPGT